MKKPYFQDLIILTTLMVKKNKEILAAVRRGEPSKVLLQLRAELMDIVDDITVLKLQWKEPKKEKSFR